MTNLITIKNENGKQTVSARELYEKLEITERFNSWFERMLKYGFEKDVDFVGCKVFNTLAKQELDEYYISLDMAKEICMIQRSEIGRQFRQYFIEAEKQFRNIVENNTVQINQSKSDRELDILEKQIATERANFLHELANEYEGKSKTYKQILDAHATKELTGEFLLPLPKIEKKTYSATEIGNIVGISAMKVGKITNENNLKTEEYGEWIKDKSKYSSKEVETFRYYDSIVDRLKEYI